MGAAAWLGGRAVAGAGASRAAAPRQRAGRRCSQLCSKQGRSSLIAHLVSKAVGVLVLAQDTAAKPPTPSPKTLLDYIGSGGVIGMFLIFLSIAAVTLLIMHLIQVRRTQLVPVDAATELQRLFRENDIQGAIRYCERGDSFLTRVFHAALTR